jgi:proteic killer suppression protein
MLDIFAVKISKRAMKDFDKVPLYIAIKLQSWIMNVGMHGLRATQAINGFRDELLKGDREGQRSIRLNRAYRAIYIIEREECWLEIIEVMKHEY